LDKRIRNRFSERSLPSFQANSIPHMDVPFSSKTVYFSPEKLKFHIEVLVVGRK